MYMYAVVGNESSKSAAVC